MRLVLIAGGISLFLSLILTPIFAKFLRQKGLAQAIRQSTEDIHYPDHETKVGTPAMGGAVILFSLFVGYSLAHIITFRVPSYSSFVALFLTFALGAVGFADDYLKIFKQRSSGIRARTKFGGQIVCGAIFAWLVTQNPSSEWLNPTNSTLPPASQAISFVRDTGLILPAGLFIIWVIFIVVSATNAVNLTDGLDGLATGASVMSFGAYTVISVWQYGQSCIYEAGPRCYSVADPFDLSVFAAAFAGALLGFLWYNTSPAQIFMGDTGSLAIGGGLAALAIMSKTQMLLPLIGLLFVATAVSVILQVGSFKLRGKRIFRMAPLHHHFELLGWHEVTIVVRFWLIHALGVALAIAIFYAEWIRQ